MKTEVKSYRVQKTEAARAALKAAGLSGVTVRYKRVTYSSKLIFTVRDPSTSIAAVQKVADSFEKIDRCAVSGEILLGGNTYIDVDTGPLVDAHAFALWESAIRACYAALPPVGTNSGVPLDDRMTVYRERPGEWKIYVEGDTWRRVWFGDNLDNIRGAAVSLFIRYGAPVPIREERRAA